LMARRAKEVVTEAAKRRIILLKDDRLSLHVADLFSDDLFSHFLQNGETLLNNCDSLTVADDFAPLLYDDLVEIGVIEVA